MSKLVLIDGHSILNRAFYGVPDLTNAQGLHTNAVFGFLNIMFKILEEEKPEYLTVAFDVNAPTFRHQMYKEYKGTRKGMPNELIQQVPVMKELLCAMQVNVTELSGYEADDLLGTIAKTAESQGLFVSLISGDKDLLQIATEHIKIRIPKTKQGKTEIEDYYAQDVILKYQVTPAQIIDLKGLMGDSSDNIPGVPGIGEKRATAIIAEFGSVEGAMEHIDKVMPNKARENLETYYEQALLSKKLATICTTSPVSFSFEDAKIKNFYTKEAYQLVQQMEFKSLLSRFSSEFGKNDEMERSFQTISTMKSFEIISKELKNGTGVVGIHVLAEKEADLDGLFGVSFAYTNASGEINCVYVNTNAEILEEKIQSLIAWVLENGRTLSFLDLKSQLKYIKVQMTDQVFDLSLAAYLLNPLKEAYFYDDLARDYLSSGVPSKTELLEKRSFEKAGIEIPEKLAEYCCYNAMVANLAYKPLMDELQKEGEMELYTLVEMPLLYTLFDMEQRGVLVNKEALVQYGNQLTGRILELEALIYEKAGESFNINSPKQLGVILFEKLKLPYAKKTKTGYSTSADLLEKLRLEDPIVGFILEYRQLTKLKSTYADGLCNYISPVDGRIHSTFNQMVTATGRISSTEPNLQNIPIRVELGRKIRKVFIPKPGFIFLDADYSQIELRVLAHMSGDEKLICAYQNADDIHKITASEVFHTPLSEVTKEQRSNAKAVNFGIVYGISSFGLGQDLNISKKEAEGYIKKYFQTYPKVKEFLDQLVEHGKKTGYVTTIFQRKRPIPELLDTNFMRRSFGERVAMNSPIQGSAADIIKIAMIRVNNRLKKEKLQSHLLLQVHDELLIETAVMETAQVETILKEEMQHAADLLVELEIDVNQGEDWYEAK